MRVLVATDGSEMAGIACEQAMDLTARTDGVLRIVGVIPPREELFSGFVEPAIAYVQTESIEGAVTSRLREVLEAELVRAPDGVRVSTTLLHGRPAPAILYEARAWRADLIVVGSRGHGTIAAILLGSVSQELIDRSDIPVLVARRPKVGRLLVGVDPAGSSDEAVAFLRRHRLLGATSAKVVSVVVPMYPWWAGIADAGGVVGEGFGAVHEVAKAASGAAIETTVGALGAVGTEVVGECHEGMVADELERSIADWDADIAVIGSRRIRAIDALVLGSVARDVVHRASSSVLVVHPNTPAVPRTPRPAAEPVAPKPEEHPMKILLAYDGDPSAERALQTAAKMAKAFDGTIDVISVIPFHAGRAPMDPWDDREIHDLELQDAVKRLAILGLTCTTIEPVGAVAPEIERVAREGSYDLVVVGSRGLGTLDRLLQGSVSEHVATHAGTTVVIAR